MEIKFSTSGYGIKDKSMTVWIVLGSASTKPSHEGVVMTVNWISSQW